MEDRVDALESGLDRSEVGNIRDVTREVRRTARQIGQFEPVGKMRSHDAADDAIRPSDEDS